MSKWFKNLFKRKKYRHAIVRLLPVDPEHDIRVNGHYITSFGIVRVIDLKAGVQKRVGVVTNKHHRYLRPNTLMCFKVYDPEVSNLLRVKDDEYKYLMDGIKVKFRRTRRGLAELSPDTRRRYEGYKLIQKTHNGTQILRKLVNAGYKITK